MGQSSPGQQTSGPPEWLQGPIQEYLGRAGQLANRPYENYQGMRVAPFTDMQNQAFGGIGNTMYGSQGMDNAQGYIANMLGQAPGSNPYLQGVINDGARSIQGNYYDATRGTTSRYNEPGQWGGSAQRAEQGANDENLARALGGLEQQTRYADFNNSIGRQMQAVPLAGQLAQQQQGLFEGGLRAGNLQQQYGQSLADSLYGDWRENRDWGQNNFDNYGNAIGRVMGGSGNTTTTQEGNNPWSNALGTGLLAYGLYNGMK